MTLFSGIKKLVAGLSILLRESYILESPLTRPYPMPTLLNDSNGLGPTRSQGVYADFEALIRNTSFADEAHLVKCQFAPSPSPLG